MRAVNYVHVERVLRGATQDTEMVDEQWARIWWLIRAKVLEQLGEVNPSTGARDVARDMVALVRGVVVGQLLAHGQRLEAQSWLVVGLCEAILRHHSEEGGQVVVPDTDLTSVCTALAAQLEALVDELRLAVAKPLIWGMPAFEEVQQEDSNDDDDPDEV